MHPALREMTDAPLQQARIWTARLETLTESEIAELFAILSVDEKQRAARFHFERDRNHFIGARGLLRSLLSAALDEPAAALRFTYGAHGKPALAEIEDAPHFNLSHAHGWAMIALSTECEVGIDLESLARVGTDEKGLSRLAARILSAREFERWNDLPASEQGASFLRAWTRKEACAKATGRGVFEMFEKLEVILDANAPRSELLISTSVENGLTSNLLVHDLPAPTGFAAALALTESRIVREEIPVFARSRNA